MEKLVPWPVWAGTKLEGFMAWKFDWDSFRGVLLSQISLFSSSQFRYNLRPGALNLKRKPQNPMNDPETHIYA